MRLLAPSSLLLPSSAQQPVTASKPRNMSEAASSLYGRACLARRHYISDRMKHKIAAAAAALLGSRFEEWMNDQGGTQQRCQALSAGQRTLKARAVVC